MKKILPYIFILTVIVQLFAPFSVGVDKKRKEISINNNVVFAEEEDQKINAKIIATVTTAFDYIKIEGSVIESGSSSTDSGFLDFKKPSGFNSFTTYTYLLDKDNKQALDKDNNLVLEQIKPFLKKGERFNHTFENLNSCTPYRIKVKLYSDVTTTDFDKKTETTSKLEYTFNESYITECKDEESVVQETKIEVSGSQENLSYDTFNCTWDHLRGCFAEFAYTILFKPSAFLFGLTGRAMDLTLKYSLDDTSYRSVFVVEGWGIVRDICNIFFIFVLLFIAFQVILGLGGKGDPKGLIVNVIIIGLLINFSLFATRIIIDASNILSRVFYNAETINIKSKGKDLGSLGEIKFSEALVQKINPISLLTDSSKVGDLKGAMQTAEDDQQIGSRDVEEVSSAIPIGLGTFVIICFLCAALCIVGVVVFLNLALVFIARVVMLWLAMVISPLAFFSYTVPRLQKMPFIGFGNWINETVKMAFVAPVFCFFMYIIISFLEEGLGLINVGQNATGFDFVLGIFVPFIFLAILLMKTKELVMSMSGQAGKMIEGAGEKIAGTALGLASGGAAMAMRGTIGRLGSKMASSERLTKMEDKGGIQGFLGRNLRNAGLSLGTKSYDVRNTRAGKIAAKQLGVEKSINDNLSSKSKPGVGVIGNRDERLKRIEERQTKRDKFKPQTEEEKDKEKLTEQQIRLENKNAVEIEKKEKEKEKAKEEYDEKTTEFKRTEDNRKVAEAEYNRSKGTADEAGKKKVLDDAREQEANALKERNEADAKLKKAREEVANINKGGKIVNIDGAGNHIVNKYNTTNGNITQEMYSKAQEKKREAEAEEAVALAEKQRLEGEKDDKILNIGAEERRKSAQATLVFDEEKQKAEDKRDETIRMAEQSFDTQIGDKETELKNLQNQLILATDPQKVSQINAEKAKITQKIKDLETNKTKQVSNIRTKADQEYNEMMKLITKNKTDQVAQASKEADEKRQAIIETVRTAGDRHTEAQNKTRVTTATANFAEEAKTYAESNGGFGKSSSDLKKEINELDSKIKQNTNEMTINRADHIPGSWMLTRDQVREKRSKIIESAKRK